MIIFEVGVLDLFFPGDEMILLFGGEGAIFFIATEERGDFVLSGVSEFITSE